MWRRDVVKYDEMLRGVSAGTIVACVIVLIIEVLL